MKAKGIELCWIVVKDLQAAIRFYTEVVGLQVVVSSPEFGWAELVGQNNGATCRLGLTQEDPTRNEIAGTNAVITISVPDILEAREELIKKGASLEGEILEVPGHVRLQSLRDRDGNRLQLVETLD